MNKMACRLLSLSTAVLLLPARVLAAGGGGVDAIVIVADSRRFSGWEAWFTNLYNDSMVAFTALTVITIPVVGVILGLTTDFLMSRVGIDLKSKRAAGH